MVVSVYFIMGLSSGRPDASDIFHLRVGASQADATMNNGKLNNWLINISNKITISWLEISDH